MYKLTRNIKRMTFSLFIITLLFSSFPKNTEAFSDQMIQRGATGDDVIELQARLQNYGYYTGTIDGVYGWGTYWSVRNFQNDFGLEVDGLVGDELKKKLEEFTHYDKDYVYSHLEKGKDPDTYGPKKGPEGVAPPGQRDPGNKEERQQEEGKQEAKQQRKQPQQQPKREEAPAQPEPAEEEAPQEAPAPETPAEPAPDQPAPAQPTPPAEGNVGQLEEAVNIPGGFSENDIRLMSNAVYGEARGEPYQGQVAIAAVILNRVDDAEFPNTVSGVIFEPRAFTAVADGQMWLQPDETARRAVMDAINGWDPSGGLTHYYNPVTATSQWMFNKQVVKRIGKHVFVR